MAQFFHSNNPLFWCQMLYQLLYLLLCKSTHDQDNLQKEEIFFGLVIPEIVSPVTGEASQYVAVIGSLKSTCSNAKQNHRV